MYERYRWFNVVKIILVILHMIFFFQTYAKEKKFYVSKLVTDWKTRPECVFFFFTFFFLFSWADVSNLSRSQLWLWTRHKTEHRVEEVCCSKCFIVSVLSFSYILTSKLIKHWNIFYKKYLKAWILLNQMCTEKQTCAAALRHTISFF